MPAAPTHRLLVLRHAKAAHGGDVADHQRPLTDRGRRQARGVGAWLAGAGLVPDLVLSSDALRAKGTADLVVHAMPGVALRAVPELYEASAQAVMQLVSQTAESVRTLLVVGHEPTMSAFVTALTGRPVSFPTAAVAVVDLGVPWGEIARDAGNLVEVRSPAG